MSGEESSEAPQPQPKPMLSPDGTHYWLGDEWLLRPAQPCEWDGFEWKSKPSGVESHWDGSAWVTKPKVRDARWNGTEFVSPSTPGESKWNGKKWVARPTGRSYWDGKQWKTGRKPLVKFGVPMLAGVVLLTGAGVLTGIILEANEKAEQQRIQTAQAAEQQRVQDELIAKQQALYTELDWTNKKTRDEVERFQRDLVHARVVCSPNTFSPGISTEEEKMAKVDGTCFRQRWESLLPSGPAAQIIQVTPVYTKYPFPYAFTVTDVLTGTFCVKYDDGFGQTLSSSPCSGT